MRTAQSDLPIDLINFVHFDTRVQIKIDSFREMASNRDQNTKFLFEQFDKISKEIDEMKKEHDKFKQFLMTLKTQDRKILYEFYIKQKPVKVIAERMGLTVDTINKILIRTRKKYEKFKTRG